ncbi:MAG: hypothetical protein EOO68_01310 [Moraxellaceae bacterium]|jgi:DNA-binding LacI/PurR family transcriptional regulator|nr:MAG: hypothetical protein EOO68_01310 [Moraxellaceae bacterium]
MSTDRKNIRVALFTPYHEGFFYGEIINHVRLLCKLKNYSLDVIATHSFGEYQSEFWLANIGAVIIIRNAISPNFAALLSARGIPCVSIAYDYFPAPISLVCSDNRQGIQLAFEHLVNRGHTRIAYIGDLTQYDLRKRYEAYCEEHVNFNLPLDEELSFFSKNTTYLGGFNAATEFVKRDCDATAVIAGAGLLAEGFKSRLNDISPRLFESIEIVAFDVMPVQILSDKSTVAIDLNLMFIAHNCITIIERVLAGHDVEHQTKVDCRLVTLPAFGEATADDLPRCLEESSFTNSPYMKSLITNMYEWSMAIAATGLSDVMSLSPLFDQLLKMGLLFRLTKDSDAVETARLIKVCKRRETLIVDKYDTANQCAAEQAQNHFAEHFEHTDYELTTSIPIIVNTKLWGVFTACGTNEIGNSRNNYLALLCYLDLSIQFLTKNILASLDAAAEKKSASTAVSAEKLGIVQWDFSKGVVTWSDEALLFLGLTSALEKNIYMHMELDDRVHEEDQAALRVGLYKLHEHAAPLNISVRMKAKTGAYTPIRIDGRLESSKHLMMFELRQESGAM